MARILSLTTSVVPHVCGVGSRDRWSSTTLAADGLEAPAPGGALLTDLMMPRMMGVSSRSAWAARPSRESALPDWARRTCSKTRRLLAGEAC